MASASDSNLEAVSSPGLEVPISTKRAVSAIELEPGAPSDVDPMLGIQSGDADALWQRAGGLRRTGFAALRQEGRRPRRSRETDATPQRPDRSEKPVSLRFFCSQQLGTRGSGRLPPAKTFVRRRCPNPGRYFRWESIKLRCPSPNSMFSRRCQPDRAKENSPPIHRWVSVRKADEPRQGRQSRVEASNIFFRPSPGSGHFPPVTHG